MYRSQIKGGTAQIELQHYSLVRQLATLKLHSLAWTVSKQLLHRLQLSLDEQCAADSSATVKQRATVNHQASQDSSLKSEDHLDRESDEEPNSFIAFPRLVEVDSGPLYELQKILAPVVSGTMLTMLLAILEEASLASMHHASTLAQSSEQLWLWLS